MLDLHTFGASKGAVHLVHRLNELNNPQVTRNVTSFLNKRNRMVHALAEMSNREARITFANLLKDSINTFLIKDAPEIISTLTRNVALSALKVHILCAPEYDPDESYTRATTGSEFDFGDDE